MYYYYKNWYNSVIRALLNIHNYADEYALLAKQVYPPITQKQAAESIKLMLELKLIKKNKSGFYKPVDKVLFASDSIKSELLKLYQLNCIDIAKDVFFSNTVSSQKVVTKMISISKEGYKRIEKKVSKTSSEINSIIHKDENKADRIYQLNIILVPQSK